jgi:hypothetical protein
MYIKKLLEEGFSNLPIHYVEIPQSPNGFKDTVKRFIDKVKKPVLVRIDHTILAKISAQDGDRVTMLMNLMQAGNDLKKEYPVINLFLTQLLRDFEDRQEDGTQNAFPRQSDVYGSDSCAMFSEIMILLNKPSKYGISYYGNSGQGMVVENNMVFAHLVKNRNSAPDLIIPFKEDFAFMNMHEL